MEIIITVRGGMVGVYTDNPFADSIGVSVIDYDCIGDDAYYNEIEDELEAFESRTDLTCIW